MTDKRFFSPRGPFPLGELAMQVGGELENNASAGVLVRDVADLDQAGDGDVGLFCDADYAKAFATSHASVIVTSRKLSDFPHNGSALLISEAPRTTFARIGEMLYPTIAEAASIHPTAVIGKDVKIGARCVIGPHVVIEDGVVIGDDCRIGAGSVISHALIGNKVKIAYNVSIGSEGFGFVPGPSGPLKVAQVGLVILQDRTEVGSNCTIDRGCLGNTVIGAMSALDDQVHIAHNVQLGRACMIAAQVGIAGSTTLGDGVMVGGQAGIIDHLTIGSGARIAACASVMRDVKAAERVAGNPAMPARRWHRQTIALAKLIGRKPRP